MLVCGEVQGEKFAFFNNGEIIYINDDEFDNYLSSHKITFDANGGNEVTDVKNVPLNTAIGELPIATRDYYTFDGWFTEAEGGEKVTEETIMTALTDITLYAHWVENAVSAWTLASSIPTDAEIVNRKYTYKLTSYTTSPSTSLGGWGSYYDSSWVWGSWGNWSGWSTNNPGGSDNPGNGDSRQRESKWVDTSYNKTVYVYSHWRNSAGYYANYQYSSNYWYEEIEVDSPLSLSGYTANGGIPYYGDNHWFPGTDWEKHNQTRSKYVSAGHTEYRYRDRSKEYTYYYKKTESKESATYPTGENISDIKEYVQYRTK